MPHPARSPTLAARIWLVLLLCLPARIAGSAVHDDDLCRRAAATAAAETGVPLRVLWALALTETGRDTAAGLAPWPWTLNMAGAGSWFDTRAAALAALEQALAAGMTNVDVGCFQLNLRWHAAGFASAADMLDPQRNADYAARLVAGHYASTGEWQAAAAAYHSRKPEHADRYLARFLPIYAALGDGPAAATAAVSTAAPENGFPLLQPGPAASPGSLVTLHAPGRRLIGG